MAVVPVMSARTSLTSLTSLTLAFVVTNRIDNLDLGHVGFALIQPIIVVDHSQKTGGTGAFRAGQGHSLAVPARRRSGVQR